MGSARDASRTAAEAVERARSDPSVRFKYTDAILGGHPAIRFDRTNTRDPQASERRYCLSHNDHLLTLRFGTTSPTTFEPVFDSMVASIELGDPDRECLLGELSMTDYAPASIECVIVGALIAAGSGEDFSGRHLLAALVRGDSGIAASVLQTLGVTPGRLGEDSQPAGGPDIAILETPVPPAMFALLTQVIPGYARETVRTHHVLLAILSSRNQAGGLDLLAELGVQAAEARTALVDQIAFENDASCVFCSFCRKPALDVARMTPNRFSQICDECVAACTALVRGQRGIPDSPMTRYADGKQTDIYTACGYCGAEDDLFTAAPQTRFICGACALSFNDVPVA